MSHDRLYLHKHTYIYPQYLSYCPIYIMSGEIQCENTTQQVYTWAQHTYIYPHLIPGIHLCIMFQQTVHDVKMSTLSCPMKSRSLPLQKHFTNIKYQIIIIITNIRSLDKLYFNGHFPGKAGQNTLVGTLETRNFHILQIFYQLFHLETINNSLIQPMYSILL